MGGTNSWVAGSARVPFAAGVDAVLPAAFARLHERYRTPHVALIVQAAAATLLFLASVFVSLGGGRTSVQEAYDIMVNLTILVYFVPYLYLFAAWISLRRREAGRSCRSHRDQHFRRHDRRRSHRRVWLSGDVDCDWAGVCASAGYPERSQLRSQPRRPGAAALHHRVRLLWRCRPTAADVVIVGGSVVGCSAAWHLRADGFTGRIVVVEQDPTYRRASAFLAMGGIRQQFCTPVTVQMVQYSVRLWKEFDQRFRSAGHTPHAWFRQRGYLFLGDQCDVNSVDAPVSARAPRRRARATRYRATTSAFSCPISWSTTSFSASSVPTMVTRTRARSCLGFVMPPSKRAPSSSPPLSRRF